MCILTLTLFTLSLCVSSITLAADTDALDIGSRRQLFVGRDLIDSMDGVRQVLHQPTPREIAIKAEHPWEKYGLSYMVTFKDGEKFRAWYRGEDAPHGKNRHSRIAYAESTDGIHWHKPKLGIIEFNGSKDNNLVWSGPGGNMAPFKDGNPAAKAGEQYKAVVRRADLFALVSPDGLHWRPADKHRIFTDRPFDSHNIAFWDDPAQQYVAYTRGVRTDGPIGQAMEENRHLGGYRWVRRAASADFANWTKLEPIQTGDAPCEHLYTNATIRYERAPDYLLMFPSRFASAREPKPGWKMGKGVNDVVFLSSRDGIHFDRTFMEAFIRPGLDQGNWHERSLYMERGILQTSLTELSLYCKQNWRLPSVHIRRYTLRPDGFVSVQAGYKGGTLFTKPIRFCGNELRLNFSTSAVGWIKVELRDASDKPIPGFTLTDCPEIYGDKLDAPVSWSSGGNVGSLAGKAIRLCFQMSDADLYAFRFTNKVE